MNPLKKLAGQTAIYGLSSIVARVLNYLLTPLYTSKGVFAPDQYGVITEMYSYVAFLVVLLTYGMETTFFRFSSKGEAPKNDVYTTVLFSLLGSTSVFVLMASLFADPIAIWLQYPDHREYVIWFAFIVGLDALSSIPLAKLRAENKAKKFAFINIAFVVVNILLNVFFLMYCLPNYEAGVSNFLIDTFYNPEIGVGYVFIANLVATVIKFLLIAPEMFAAKGKFVWGLLRKMGTYAFPLLLFSLAIIINEHLDKLLLKYILVERIGLKATMTEIGIYGACYKLSVVINLFVQAFRYAAEPFFFSQEKEKNSGEVYSKVLTYFVIILSTIFLGVMLYIDIFKYFIPNEAYWVGLNVVPILLMANIFLGIYYNLSIWYKLSGKTIYGAYLAGLGASITVGLNLLWIPHFGYEGSAWATLLCYATMMIASYFLGQRKYPVNYRVGRVIFYLVAALAIYLLSNQVTYPSVWIQFGIAALILLGWLGMIYILERPKKDLFSST